MTPSVKSKSVAILTAAAVSGLVMGATIKPSAASSIAGVSPQVVTLDNNAPSTQPSGKNGCVGSKGKNSCGGPNGCHGK